MSVDNDLAQCAIFTVVIALILWFMPGCGGGLSATDKADLTNAARLNGMAYAYEDASSPPAALQRGAYCATAAVLRDQKMAVPDAGIACQP